MPLLEPPLWEVLALLLGLIVGSFANVCIHRLPRGQSVVRPPSACPRCGRAIRAWDNVPVLSYLVLLGRCRSCRAPISPRYPLVEAANGLLWAAVAAQRGPTPDAPVQMVFVTAMLVLALIDLDHQILPNDITYPGIVAGLAASFLPGATRPGIVIGLAASRLHGPPNAWDAAIAAILGYWGLRLFAWAFERIAGVEGMGWGDWKMTSMIGAFLGIEKMMLTMLLASLSGAMVGLLLMVALGRGRRDPLPFGTFLAIGALIVVFSGDPILSWYRGFFPESVRGLFRG